MVRKARAREAIEAGLSLIDKLREEQQWAEASHIVNDAKSRLPDAYSVLLAVGTVGIGSSRRPGVGSNSTELLRFLIQKATTTLRHTRPMFESFSSLGALPCPCKPPRQSCGLRQIENSF